MPEGAEALTADRLRPVVPLPLPAPTSDWAWGGSDGAGVRIAVIDSGIDAGHPRVGPIAGYVSVEENKETREISYVEGPHEDLVGHGTACAGIIRAIAPRAEIWSVRVLGPNLTGRGAVFVAGLRWAIEAEMNVVNLSLSTGNNSWFGPLHEAADLAYFRNVVLVSALNNVAGPSFPSQYAAVISVASRMSGEHFGLAYNSDPPVEFGAHGIDVDVAWKDGASIVATGNSFAAPHVAGLVALILAKHPGMTPFQVKAILQAVAENAHPPGVTVSNA